jgi:acyl-CoA synthetase (AMP-forming)/AMP-acid ligase II
MLHELVNICDPVPLDARIARISPDPVAALMSTSGTIGGAKMAEITHPTTAMDCLRPIIYVTKTNHRVPDSRPDNSGTKAPQRMPSQPIYGTSLATLVIEVDGSIDTTDRIKDMIGFNGLQASPTELGSALLKLPVAKDCAVFSKLPKCRGVSASPCSSGGRHQRD